MNRQYCLPSSYDGGSISTGSITFDSSDEPRVEAGRVVPLDEYPLGDADDEPLDEYRTGVPRVE